MDSFSGKAMPFTESGFTAVASDLGGNACSLWALISVETRGFGFLSDRRLKMLFERHKFSELTNGTYDASHPDISSPIRGGYAGGGAEYERLNIALGLNREAALRSASWGLGQIMGFNASRVGYQDAMAMINVFRDGEDSQLAAIRTFIIKNEALAQAYRSKDWRTVALNYNGPNYSQNNYAGKLKSAFEDYLKNGTPNIEVRTAQAHLTYLNFDPKGIDGVIGTNTEAALAAFQAYAHLEVTRRLDEKTLAELEKRVDALQAQH